MRRFRDLDEQEQLCVQLLLILAFFSMLLVITLPLVNAKRLERERVVHAIAVRNGVDVTWGEWLKLDHREREAILSGSGYRHRK